MARSIKCPHCAQVVKVGDHAAGKRLNCPACKKAFRAPQAAAVGLSPPEKPTEPAGPPKTPAAAPARIWFFHVDGRNDGPHTVETVLDQVKTGRLDGQTLVWKQGMGDWQPLGEVPDFRGAIAVPPPVVRPKLRSKPPIPKAHKGEKGEHEHEPRAHYGRGRGRRDVMVGLWVAGALALAALVALLVVLNQKESTPPPPPKQPIQVVEPLPPVPQPGTTLAPPTPQPVATPVPKKTPKAQPSNTALLASFVSMSDKGFSDAIAAHKKARRAPIRRFATRLREQAAKLEAADWGPYKAEGEALVKTIRQAGDGIERVITDPSKDAWDVHDPKDIDEKMAKLMECDDVKWLENWQRILADALDKVRKKGLDF